MRFGDVLVPGQNNTRSSSEGDTFNSGRRKGVENVRARSNRDNLVVERDQGRGRSGGAAFAATKGCRCLGSERGPRGVSGFCRVASRECEEGGRKRGGAGMGRGAVGMQFSRMCGPSKSRIK
jgi:hypothetical protein